MDLAAGMIQSSRRLPGQIKVVYMMDSGQGDGPMEGYHYK